MTSTSGAGDGILMDAGALEEFMTAAFGQPLNWTIERVGTTGIRVRQPTSSANSRPGGTVSGPTLMSLADGVAYMVLLSRIGPAALAVTSNLNINFLRRPRLVDLVADATILKLGRSLAVTEVSLYSDSGGERDLLDPVAHATITYSLALLGDGADRTDPTGGTGITGAVQIPGEHQ
ncbi:MAG: PaaI family thioesterase [Microthrixaceae bacterium]